MNIIKLLGLIKNSMKKSILIIFLLTTRVISSGEKAPEEKIEFHQIKPDVIDHVLIRFNSYADSCWITDQRWIRYDIVRVYPDRVLLEDEFGIEFNIMKEFMNIPSLDIKLIK